MKSNKAKRIMIAVGDIDDNYIAEVDPTDKATVTVVRIAPWLRWAIPAAACLVIAALIAIPTMLNKHPVNNGEQGNQSIVAGGGNMGNGAMTGGELQIAGNSIESIFGLPTGDYTWDEGSGMVADRMSARNLPSLFFAQVNHPNLPFAFVVARITGVDRDGDIQIATAEPVFDVLGTEVGSSFQIFQTLYGGCMNDEQTNLVREGGVYFLPLAKGIGDIYWRIHCDLDVLFEVDDRNIIHSHSVYQELNKYDGMELAYLWKDASYLYMHPVITSWFGNYISQGYEIEMAGVNNIALVAPDGSWNEDDAHYFSAKIGGDGKITVPWEDFSVFKAVEGLTVHEMNEQIDLVKRWYGLANPDPEEAATPDDVTVSQAMPSPSSETTPNPIDASKNGEPILTVEIAEQKVIDNYFQEGFGNAKVEFQAVTTLWESTTVYLFYVTLPDSTDLALMDGGEEYAGIITSNGNFIRLERMADGGFAVFTGVRSN